MSLQTYWETAGSRLIGSVAYGPRAYWWTGRRHGRVETGTGTGPGQATVTVVRAVREGRAAVAKGDGALPRRLKWVFEKEVVVAVVQQDGCACVSLRVPHTAPGAASTGGIVIMRRLKGFIKSFTAREEGQTLTEYGLILFFIAVVAVAAVTLLGGRVSTMFDEIRTAIGG